MACGCALVATTSTRSTSIWNQFALSSGESNSQLDNHEERPRINSYPIGLCGQRPAFLLIMASICERCLTSSRWHFGPTPRESAHSCWITAKATATLTSLTASQGTWHALSHWKDASGNTEDDDGITSWSSPDEKRDMYNEVTRWHHRQVAYFLGRLNKIQEPKRWYDS